MKHPRTILALAVAGLLAGAASQAQAQERQAATPPHQSWSFSGPFGMYDQEQLQRGFKVYREVCSNCHSLNLVHFRNLAEPGGPGFTEAQAKAIAEQYQITAGPNDKGQMFKRPGRLADAFPPPYPNPEKAKAVFGAAPPDMSTLAKARYFEQGFPFFLFDIFTQYQEEGPDYIAALVQGYRPTPKGVHIPPNDHYNIYFPGHALAMPPPLTQNGRIHYDDGAPETVQQYAKDIAAFLMWASEPHLDQRKRVGFQVMVFLIIFAGLLYFTKKKVWKEVELHPEMLKDKP